MLLITFSGWAQCRLATDPDPYDESRGVSGYMRAYSDEPDLDRIIRFRNPPVHRSHTPDISVTVTGINLNGQDIDEHPLLGAAVDLLDSPKFEGRNGVIAEDGQEPVVPYHLLIEKNGASFSRATVPSNPQAPYREFNAINFKNDPAFIQKHTGIPSLIKVWTDRLAILKGELVNATGAKLVALNERIGFLERNLAANGGSARFFSARMEWAYQLKSPVLARMDDLTTLLPGFVASKEPWSVSFWFGGWDADAQCFYTEGCLAIPEGEATPMVTGIQRPERATEFG